METPTTPLDVKRVAQIKLLHTHSLRVWTDEIDFVPGTDIFLEPVSMSQRTVSSMTEYTSVACCVQRFCTKIFLPLTDVCVNELHEECSSTGTCVMLMKYVRFASVRTP